MGVMAPNGDLREEHHYNALESSGTSPNFRNTVASLKLPVAGSPVRENATAPVWPNTFQRPCARSIAAAGLGHSMGSPTTTLPSATSNGSATKYVIPGIASPLLSHTNPCDHAARIQTCHAHNHSRRRPVAPLHAPPKIHWQQSTPSRPAARPRRK